MIYNPLKSFLLIFFTCFLFTNTVAQQNKKGKTLDQIVAVVNDHIILKSDVDQQVTDYMIQMRQQSGQDIEFQKDIWYTVLRNIVDRYILLDQAKEDSVTVTEDQVNRNIDQRIQQAISTLGSEEALERQVGKSIVQLRADLRDTYREEMIVQRFRQQLFQDIQITRPEVIEYFESIPKDSLPTIPEQVAVSQIVKVPPPLDDARQGAYDLAKSLRDSIINHGKSIEELARRHSDGPSAPRGGKLPMMSLNDLVAEYSAAASNLQPGEYSEVVETSFGFHIIRLNKRSGDQIDTNHILISIDKESYNDQAAIDSLTVLRDSVINNPDVSFAELARKHSDDPNTAPSGGRVLNPRTGERLIPINQLDPALYRIVLLLEEEGDISEPKPFNMGQGNSSKTAYRIVRLDQRIEEHVANIKQDYNRIKNNALQQKRLKAIQNLIKELKEDTYIEYRIPIPQSFKQT